LQQNDGKEQGTIEDIIEMVMVEVVVVDVDVAEVDVAKVGVVAASKRFKIFISKYIIF